MKLIHSEFLDPFCYPLGDHFRCITLSARSGCPHTQMCGRGAGPASRSPFGHFHYRAENGGSGKLRESSKVTQPVERTEAITDTWCLNPGLPAPRVPLVMLRAPEAPLQLSSSELVGLPVSAQAQPGLLGWRLEISSSLLHTGLSLRAAELCNSGQIPFPLWASVSPSLR